MEEKLTDLAIAESLIEELSDEELAACVGGCDLDVNLLGINLYSELPELTPGTSLSVNLLGLVSTKYDGNGSGRWKSKYD